MQSYFPDGLDDNVLTAASDSGYSNDEIHMDWIEHFNACTKKRQTSPTTSRRRRISALQTPSQVSPHNPEAMLKKLREYRAVEEGP